GKPECPLNQRAADTLTALLGRHEQTHVAAPNAPRWRRPPVHDLNLRHHRPTGLLTGDRYQVQLLRLTPALDHLVAELLEGGAVCLLVRTDRERHQDESHVAAADFTLRSGW